MTPDTFADPDIFADTDMAIVGMACRFPKAADLAAFWRMIELGLDGATPLSDAELTAAGVPEQVWRRPDYVRTVPVLDRIDQFDSAFFDMSVGEAAMLDPQHRLALELAWEALEDSAIAAHGFKGAIGCFVGMGPNGYFHHNVLPGLSAGDVAGFYQAMAANGHDFLATRIAYKLGLKGPAATVQTACSTSLVGVHLACQALMDGGCDVALAGGVAVRVPHGVGYVHQPGMIFSPDGLCRSFDAGAQGTVGGSGGGMVALMRASDAVAQGRPIHALIRGSAINNDGARKAGFTAPSIDGQAAVIAEAHAVAGISPDHIGYVEAHGTATELGDPIEIAALTKAFRKRTARTGYCAIGSVKANFGHLDAAAGIAGLIKAALILERAVLPPLPHFRQPNPHVDFAASPFVVHTESRPWPQGEGPRLAGVSSFGIGGTNAHVILAEPPPSAPAAETGTWRAVPISARGKDALAAQAASLAPVAGDLPLDGIAATLALGRHGFEHRRVVVCRHSAQLAQALAGQGGAAADHSGSHSPGERDVAFAFPGQGSQYSGMAAGLYAALPVFRREFDRCCRAISPHLGRDLAQAMLVDGTDLTPTMLAQPALFAVETALARQWMEWGVKPQALIGHSLGELVAAHLAGVFSLEDAALLVVRRGQLMQACPPGAMAAVPLAEADVMALLPDGVEIAAVNAPGSCVVAGPEDAVTALETRLGGRRLAVSHAFHTASMAQAARDFTALVATMPRHPPVIPFISNLTGTWITDSDATDPDYWGRHLRHAVRFADGLATLLAEPSRIVVEVGPGRVLSGLAARHPAFAPPQAAIASLPDATLPDEAALLAALGRVWVAGAAVDWRAIMGPPPRYARLPSYPFQRRRHWLEPPASPVRAHDRLPLAEWLVAPAWVSARPPQAGPARRWLVLADASDLGRRLAACLGGDTVLVPPGAAWPGDVDVQGVVDCRGLDGDGLAAFARGTDMAVSLGNAGHPVKVVVLSRPIHDVTGGEDVHPLSALVTGPLRTLSFEYPFLRGHLIELDDPAMTADILARECVGGDEAVVAYRGNRRWLRRFVPVESAPAPAPAALAGAVVLVIGGMGKVGYALASALARKGARLVVAGRSPEADAEKLAGLGSDAFYVSADAADSDALTAAMAQARRRFGRLDGVIHAAGVRQSAALADVTPAFAAAQMRPKLDSLPVLAQAMVVDPPGWCLVVSSLAAVLGALGLAPYVAAHAFADAFAARANRGGSTRWICVDWDNWLMEGGDLPPGEPHLTAREGGEILDLILAGSADHVLVSTIPMAERLRRWVQMDFLAETKAQPVVSGRSFHPRPDLSAPFRAPAAGDEEKLAALWQNLLGVAPIGADDNLFELGADSLLGIQATAQAAAAGLAGIGLKDLFAFPTIAGMAATRTVTAPVMAVEECGAGDFPPPPIMRWAVETHPGGRLDWFNQSVVLELAPELDEQCLRAALVAIQHRHDALRLRYHSGRAWIVEPGGDVPFRVAEGDPAELGEALHRSLDLAAGPVWRAVLVPSRRRLIWVVHHFAVDVPSWRVLVEDLESACRAILAGQMPVFPPASLSYAGWARNLDAWARTLPLEPHWRDLIVPPLWAATPGSDPVGAQASLRSQLAPEQTDRILRHVPRRLGVSVADLLLAGVAWALSRWSGQSRVALDVEGHGRAEPLADLDRSRTVGWFTALHPVVLDVPADGRAAPAAIRAQLDRIPARGAHWPALRHGSPHAAELARLARPQAVFLFLGAAELSPSSEGALLRSTGESAGAAADPESQRAHGLEIVVWVENGRLVTEWNYGGRCHTPEAIFALSQTFGQWLAQMTQEGSAIYPGAAIAGTVVDADLDEDDLSRLLEDLQ